MRVNMLIIQPTLVQPHQHVYLITVYVADNISFGFFVKYCSLVAKVCHYTNATTSLLLPTTVVA